MKAIILAAGEGKRMRPLTLVQPKPMLEVLGRPILHHLMDSLPPEITELIIVIGYKGEQIKKYFGTQFQGRKIEYVQQDKPLGTGHALMLCREFIKPGERFLFMAGDDLHSPKALAKLIKHKHGVLVHQHNNPQRFGVIEVDASNKVIGFEETPEKPKSNLVSLAVFVLDDKIFSYPQAVSRSGEYWSTDQIRKMMREHDFIAESSDFWHPIGTPEDLSLAEQRLGAKHGKLATPVVIVAGGKGTRLPPEEQIKPKCLVEVAGKPILLWQLEHLRAQGLHDIRLALGYKAEMVVDWLRQTGNTDIKYSIEKEPLGTGGAIKLAARDIKVPFIALNVDDLADINYRLLIRHSLGDTHNIIAGAEITDARTFGTIVCDEHKRICEFKEKSPEPQPGFVSIGHYYLQPDVFDGTPAKFSIEYDIFPKLAASQKLLLCRHSGNYWLTTNTAEQLKVVREYFSKSYL